MLDYRFFLEVLLEKLDDSRIGDLADEVVELFHKFIDVAAADSI